MGSHPVGARPRLHRVDPPPIPIKENFAVISPAAAIQELRRDFASRGWCRKATARVLLDLLLNLGMAAAGAAVFLTSPHLLVRAAAVVLVAAGSMGVATNTHNSSHYATSREMWLNELLTYLGYPFFLGLSATFWWHQHVAVHHTSPNVIGVDQDANLAPWIARTGDEVARSSGLRRFYYQRLQSLALPVIIAFNSFNMTKTGWLHLGRCLSDARCRTRKHALDLAALVLHYACLLLLALTLGWRPVLALCLLRMLLMSYLMFAILAPGHFPAEAACLSRQPDPADYLRLQTSATVNFRVGWVGRLLCCGLQHQIEHHLFPGISYIYLPRVSVVLREFCRKHGLPYRSYQWDHVLYKCFATFRRPPATLTTLDAFFTPENAWPPPG
jgi:linoleoyl-CoA desaturase